jgi:3-dehydroquinate dehydratase II
MQIHIINGPNLNLLGVRQPEIYGHSSFIDYFTTLQTQFPTLHLHHYQSNVEGEIINYLHAHGFIADAIIINPGGYAHTSVAIADAIKSITAPVLEVHISNIYQRESFRHQCITAASCVGVISGLGLDGYRLGVEYFLGK